MRNNRRKFVNVEWHLRHQYRGCTSRNARLQRDPSGVPAHYFYNHHPVVALCSCVQPIYRVGGNLHCCLKTKSGISSNNVIVNGLGHSDNGQAELFVEQRANRERAIPTNNNQRIQPIVLDRLADSLVTIRGVIGASSPCAQNSAAPRKYAAHCSSVERHTSLLHDAVPRVEKPNDLIAITRLGLANYCTNDGIQARAIAAASEYADSHVFSLRLILN